MYWQLLLSTIVPTDLKRWDRPLFTDKLWICRSRKGGLSIVNSELRSEGSSVNASDAWNAPQRASLIPTQKKQEHESRFLVRNCGSYFSHAFYAGAVKLGFKGLLRSSEIRTLRKEHPIRIPQPIRTNKNTPINITNKRAEHAITSVKVI